MVACRYLSHVTRHTSHVTRHTSHAFRPAPIAISRTRVRGHGTRGGQVGQEAEFVVQLVDTVGEARTFCSSEESSEYPEANIFGPINTPASGVPTHPRMQPVTLSKCSDGLFVFKYTVKTAGLCVRCCCCCCCCCRCRCCCCCCK